MASTFANIRYAMVGDENVLRTSGFLFRIRQVIWTCWELVQRCYNCTCGRLDSPDVVDHSVPDEEAEEALEMSDVEAQKDQSEVLVENGSAPSKPSSVKSKFSKMKRSLGTRMDKILSGPSSSSGLGSSRASSSSLRGAGSSDSIFDKIGSGVTSAGKALQDTLQGLNERSDRLSNTEDVTQNLANSSQNYRDTSAQLLQKYASKSKLFG